MCECIYGVLAAPAIVTPGENTTTEVEEDGFRFFQSECPAFSMTIMIEQIDLVGTCSLYASTSVQNPGTLLSYYNYTHCTVLYWLFMIFYLIVSYVVMLIRL